MDPLKAVAALAFCLALFGLAYRLTRWLVDLAIAQGHAEERRRLAEGEPGRPGPDGGPDVPGPAAGVCTDAGRRAAADGGAGAMTADAS